MASLPESYNTLVTALEANENVPSMEIVIERLLYKKRKSKEHHEETKQGEPVQELMKKMTKRCDWS